MLRRTFLLSTAFFVPSLAMAYPAEEFTPAIWEDLAHSGDTFILNYRAAWSLTCQIKAELISEALAENAEYSRLTFIDIDWDTYGMSQLTQKLNVTRRSTLLVIKRGEELARLENEPYERKLRAFLDTALAAT